jgi:hypothetical protein
MIKTRYCHSTISLLPPCPRPPPPPIPPLLYVCPPPLFRDILCPPPLYAFSLAPGFDLITSRTSHYLAVNTHLYHNPCPVPPSGTGNPVPHSASIPPTPVHHTPVRPPHLPHHSTICAHSRCLCPFANPHITSPPCLS